MNVRTRVSSRCSAPMSSGVGPSTFDYHSWAILIRRNWTAECIQKHLPCTYSGPVQIGSQVSRKTLGHLNQSTGTSPPKVGQAGQFHFLSTRNDQVLQQII